ncbi:MAG: hypothetical protein HDP34_05280 [Clostridia bacterium]|nr:hypothetical protein [Clostridia bacterium]
MVTADWISLAVIAAFALLGVLIGFGKGLRFFTKGVFGIIISIFLCFCFGGMIMSLGFVQDLMAKIASLWVGKENFWCELLAKIKAETVIFYIILFVIAQILRIIITKFIQKFFEMDNKPMKIINKVLGALLFVAMLFLIGLFVLYVISWVGGSTAAKFESYLSGSKFLGALYRNNPVAGLWDYFKSTGGEPEEEGLAILNMVLNG